MKALISGGAGFIGSHLVDALVERGDEVCVIDDLSTGVGENLVHATARGAQLLPLDVTDLAAVESLCRDLQPDRVFHLAAQVDVRVSVGDPGRDARVNVEGTVNMLEAAHRSGAGGFLFASSCAVYGEPDPLRLPLNEGAAIRPGSPYGQAKLAAEGYVALYRELHGLNAASLRFGNVYGPRQGAVGEAGVVAIFCRELVQGRHPTVFGDGNQTRDFVFVGDVVSALLAASDGGASGEFNVGTGRETSVLELAGLLAAVAARGDFTPDLQPARPGEINRMALDAGRMESMLGWRARMPIDLGLRRTLESIQGRRLDPDVAYGQPSQFPPAPEHPSPTL